MPIHVKAVPALPYGKTPRFSLRIQSGYRAGQMLSHSGARPGTESSGLWVDREDAEQWARDTGYTVLPADPDLDTPAKVLLVDLFETFDAFQFDRPVNGGDLVEDLGRWLRKHKTVVASMQSEEAEPAARHLRDLYRTCWSLHSGDDPVNGGDLVDAFGTWLAQALPRMDAIVGGNFAPKVARSPDGESYWSEIEGWGELEDATAYFRNVPSCLQSAEPHEWIEADLATVLAAERSGERLDPDGDDAPDAARPLA